MPKIWTYIVTISALAIVFLFLMPTATVGGNPLRTHSGASVLMSAHPSQVNQRSNVLITDQCNSRGIEVNPLTQQIVWSFGSGNGSLCNPGPGSIIGVNSAERLAGGLTLMTGTGIGSGIPNTTACADNRVIVVNPHGVIVWQYGKAGVTGSGANQLNVPVFAIELPNHHILITDQGNNRIIEVTQKHQIVWKYGPKSGPGALNAPNSAELLTNGNILITDELGNRGIEVNRNHHIVSQITRGLNIVAFASRLPNHDTLIADSGNNRAVELAPNGSTVWQFY